MHFLKRAVALLPRPVGTIQSGLLKVEKGTLCDSPTVRRQDGWNAPPSTPCKNCNQPIGDHGKAT